MPRKRKRKPPAAAVEAKVAAYEQGVFAASCRHCSQHLLTFEAKSLPVGRMWRPLFLALEESDGITASAWGYRWDGSMWRPTCDHAARRQRAREAVAQTQGRERAALRERLRDGAFHHAPTKSQLSRSVGVLPARSRDAQLLPARFRCPSCDAENVVDPDLSERRNVE